MLYSGVVIAQDRRRGKPQRLRISGASAQL